LQKEREKNKEKEQEDNKTLILQNIEKVQFFLDKLRQLSDIIKKLSTEPNFETLHIDFKVNDVNTVLDT